MGIGDVCTVGTGESGDLAFVDTGMYGTDNFGSVYLLDAERPAVVETGVGTNHERILAALDTIGVDREDVAVVAVTHVHLDHAGGAGFLAEACPNADVVVHEAGADHLADPAGLVAGTRAAVGDLWEYYAEPVPVPESRLRPVTDGDVVDLGDHSLRVHEAPGHAAHQVVYEAPAVDAVFTGDAAGVWVPERGTVRATTPPPEFDLEQCLADIRTLRDIDPSTLCFSHFGPHDDPAAALDAGESALVEWVERVRTVRAESADDAAVVDHFVETTDMRDVWGDLAPGVAAVDTTGVLSYLDGSGQAST